MESNLITLNSTMPIFKSKALNTATQAIFTAVNSYNKTAAETRKTIALTLARVEKGKAYKEDGFESLAEYAAEIGLEKALAHKLENAGRMLDSENDTIRKFAENADYSKLAILASADEKAVAAAIDSGELTAESSQREVSAWKRDTAAKSAKAKVLPKFEVHIIHGNGNTKHYDAIELEQVREFDGYTRVGTFKLDSEPSNATIVFMFNPTTGAVLRYTAEKVKVEKSVKKAATIDISKLSDAQVQELLARYNAAHNKGE